MYRTLGIITASFIAGTVIVKIKQEVKDFMVLDAGSIEAHRVRKYTDKVLKESVKMRGISMEGLLETVGGGPTQITFAGSDRAKMQTGAYPS